MSDSWFDTAQICVNGHVITSSLQTSPQLSQKFCKKCGGETVSRCPNCQSAIRGYYHVPGVVSVASFPAPAYCHECGKPFPWTESRLQAATDLIALSEVNDAEKVAVIEDLPALITDTPRTKVAAAKIAALLKKVGPPIGSALRDLLLDIATDTAKKSIGL